MISCSTCRIGKLDHSDETSARLVLQQECFALTHHAFEEVFDFIVVGSGGGSMCAALFMRAVGKSVVLLEKEALIGGTTARSGGTMWIPNNRLMAGDGVEDSYEMAVTYLDATVGRS